MWHASISGRYGAPQWALLEDLARQELRGVGDASLGEWAERGDRVFHLRRRLTDREMAEGLIASVVDVRGTDEHATRVDRMRPFLPPPMQGMPMDALP